MHYNYGLWLTVHSQVLCERQVEEMKWCRIINTISHNIPWDLHMEHLNRRLKIMMCNLGVNKFQGPIKRMAKSLVVHNICSHFLDESGVTIHYHPLVKI